MPSPPTSTAVAGAPLRRNASDRVLLGVCAGTAVSLGVSAVWVRLAAVALGVTVPALALIAYAVAGVVMPRDDGRMALAGFPPDAHESLAAWGITALATIVALSRGALLLDLTDPVVLLVAAGAVAAAVALSRRADEQRSRTGDAAAPAGHPAATTSTSESADGDPTVAMPPDPEAPTVTLSRAADAPTVVMRPAHGDATAAMPPHGPEVQSPAGGHRAAADQGPSLLLLGLGALIVAALAVVLGNPMTTLALTAAQTVRMGVGIFGALAALGVVAAIAFWDRRHAVGLLVLSLGIGAVALGLAAMPEPTTITDSGSLAREVVHRIADLLRLN